MGRVRNKLIKRSARQIIEKYYSKLTFDFDTNKRLMTAMAETPSKRVRNQIAGFMTHLMKRIQRGPVKGISLKLQEEERERRLDFIPEKSAFEVESVTIDKDTQALLKSLNMTEVPVTVEAAARRPAFAGKKGGKFAGKKAVTA